jgi:formylglycine-generating enzyme required for sulfatase activity
MLRISALFAISCLSFVIALAPARAEHRVALLIGNTKYKDQEEQPWQLDKVIQAFEARGFRCQVVENLANENEFRDAIEGFASRTPTCSTAALYFLGRMSDGPGLLATDSRGKYLLDRVVTALETRGGSSRNLLFLDVPGEVKFDELPESVQLVQGDTDSLLKMLVNNNWLTGKASTVISPPDQFVLGKRAGDEWVNSMGVVFCWCPPGKYIAGSPDGVPGRYADEAQREVSIEHGFWLSKYELAFGQPVSNRRASLKSIARHKLDPMTMINHDDAKSMTRNFTQSERQAGRLPSDWQYTLPTEEQWEYAARAGTSTRYYFGEDMSQLPSHANFADKTYYDSGDIYSNSAHRTLDDGAVKLARVGAYQANPWGFHDMYGNVAEWCINLAIRGGAWVSAAENCRSAYRDSFSSRNEQNFIGYRIVIQKTPPAAKGTNNK